MGRPIVPLPKPHSVPAVIKFGRAERILYRAIEQKFRDMLNQFFAEGDPRKTLSWFLPQLTRLRQSVSFIKFSNLQTNTCRLVDHPALIERQIKVWSFLSSSFRDLFGIQAIFEVDELRVVQKRIRSRNSLLYKRKIWLDPSVHRLSDASAEINTWIGEKQEGIQDFEDLPLCRICYDAPEDTQLVPCGHKFCGGCIDDSARNQEETGIEVWPEIRTTAPLKQLTAS